MMAEFLEGFVEVAGLVLASAWRILPVFLLSVSLGVLVRALKTGKAPLQLLPALVLHPREGAKHTPEAETILRGEADLPWL